MRLLTDLVASYFCGNGRYARAYTLENRLEPADENAGEIWCCACNEHGNIVNIFFSFR